MRGQRLDEGVVFSPTRLHFFTGTAQRVEFAPADTYNFFNVREVPVIGDPIEAPVKAQTKGAYKHVARGGLGRGWGHVPQSDLTQVVKKQDMQELRKGVKPQC